MLWLSLYTVKRCFLVGQEKGCTLRYPQLFADSGSLLFVASGYTWLSSRLKYWKDFTMGQSCLRDVWFIDPFLRSLKPPDLPMHHAVERHESIQRDDSHLGRLLRPPTHSFTQPMTPSSLVPSRSPCPLQTASLCWHLLRSWLWFCV